MSSRRPTPAQLRALASIARHGVARCNDMRLVTLNLLLQRKWIRFVGPYRSGAIGHFRLTHIGHNVLRAAEEVCRG